MLFDKDGVDEAFGFDKDGMDEASGFDGVDEAFGSRASDTAPEFEPRAVDVLTAVGGPGVGFDVATSPLATGDVPGLGLVFAGDPVSEVTKPCVEVGVCGGRFKGVGFCPLLVEVLITVDHLNFPLTSVQLAETHAEGASLDWPESSLDWPESSLDWSGSALDWSESL